MTFPSNPSPGQTHIEDNTTWVYAGPINGWYRKSVNPGNATDYRTGDGYVGSDLDVLGDLTLDDGGTYTTTLQTITATANRTISFPDATGTVALVAGSSGQLVYNNAGANGGVPTSAVGATGDITLSLNGADSTPPLKLTGTWFSGGTGTTTKPQVLIEPTGTTSTAWSTSGTGLGVNAPSGFAGNLLDLQVNGARLLSVSSNGSVSAGNLTLNNPLGTVNVGPASFASGNFADFHGIRRSSAYVGSIGSFVLFGGSGNFSANVILSHEGAHTLAQRDGTNAQTFRCYGTYTDASNYVRAALSSTSTAVTLAAETAGTGADDIPLNLTAAGTGTVKVNSVAEVAVSSTVAGLPATPAVGMLTRVTDANVPAVGFTVAGGGAAAALVWYNGTNWTVIGV